jgi:hypothetical protein
MKTLRNVVGVIVGLGVFRLVVFLLENALVRAVADGPLTAEADFFAVRNEPLMLMAAFGYNFLATFLAGYVVAKIAQSEDLTVPTVAAWIQSLALLWAFVMNEYAQFTPIWMRFPLIIFTWPLMVAGAGVYINARANRPLVERNA